MHVRQYYAKYLRRETETERAKNNTRQKQKNNVLHKQIVCQAVAHNERFVWGSCSSVNPSFIGAGTSAVV